MTSIHWRRLELACWRSQRSVSSPSASYKCVYQVCVFQRRLRKRREIVAACSRWPRTIPARVLRQRRCGANNNAKTMTGRARRIGLDKPRTTGRKNALTAGGTPNNIRRTPFLGHGCPPATVATSDLPQDTESFLFHKPQLAKALHGLKGRKSATV